MNNYFDFILIIVLAIVLASVGIVLISISAIIAKKKTDKKLGYGPRYIGGELPLTWPSEYYSKFWSLSIEIKPQYKTKVDKWIQEYEKNKRKYHSYFVLGWLLFGIGIVLIIGMLFFFLLAVNNTIW